MPVSLKRKPKTCEHVKNDGTPCSNYVLTKDGVQKMLDEGISLVAAPAGRLCSFHARTPKEIYAMSVRGGSYSPKRANTERQQLETSRDPVARELAIANYTLIRNLVNAKLPGVRPPETDFRKAAL